MRDIRFRSWNSNSKKMEYMEPCYGLYNISFIEYMQYTGIKDRNGKKIYEGDLVEHEMETDGEWDKYEACEIVFDETYGMYCFKNDAPNSLKDYRNLEVIGNIYES